MTGDQEKKALLLSQAMGFLDDDLIIEAHEEAVGKRLDVILRQKLVRNLGIAACICLLALCIPNLAKLGIGDVSGDMVGGDAPPQNEAVGNSKGEYDGVEDAEDGNGGKDVMDGVIAGDPKPEESKGVGCVVRGTYGSLSFTGETDSTITLRLTLTQDIDTPLYIYFYDYAGVKATTQPNYQNDGVVIRGGRLKVTVNGEETDGSLPQLAGTYDIVVDFSSLLKDDIPLRPEFKVTGFEELVLGR